ncbi:unnamed protein product [Linum trigynum]|uniref:Cytochrome P450 n=1 Tax=Linum trigynum TaxID=586398 RepID=A0AAV2EJ67_9ROSI
MFVSLGNTIVWRIAFGRMQKQEQGFMPVMLEMVKVFGGFGLGNLFPSSKLLRMIIGTERFARKLHKEADVILEGILDEHIARRAERERANKDHDTSAAQAAAAAATEDLVDALLNLKDDGKGHGFAFTNVEIKGVILDMFLGGSDTSTATVEWAMSELMRNPRVMEKAQNEVRRVFDGRGGAVDKQGLEELSYLKLVVKEAFRMHPPAPLLAPRECQKTVTIAGYEIPAKTRVMINILAIGRDPRHWTKPDEFYPERFLDRPPVDIHGTHFEFTPFGAGRRMCPGVLFGAALVELLLTHLLYHFDWKLPSGTDPQNLDMSECFGVVVRRNTDLHLISVPYHPKTVY